MKNSILLVEKKIEKEMKRKKYAKKHIYYKYEWQASKRPVCEQHVNNITSEQTHI